MKETKILEKAVNQLLKTLKRESDKNFPDLAKYTNFTAESGRKFIKIIEQDSFNGEISQRVWGFINISEFTKERKMASTTKVVTFKEGDVLMANGWRAPALNAPRGNILDGYNITKVNRYGPSYISSNRTL